MKMLTNGDLEKIEGGWQEGALTQFGAQLAADGLNHAGSSNPIVAGLGVIAAAAGGWAWAAGSFYDGLTALF